MLFIFNLYSFRLHVSDVFMKLKGVHVDEADKEGVVFKLFVWGDEHGLF